MPRLKPCRQTPATAGTRCSEIQERIHKLVLRVVQCTFGADSALRRAVLLGARQMLEAGAV